MGSMPRHDDSPPSQAPELRYRALRQAMRHALARHGRWRQMPALMNELDQARRALGHASPAAAKPPQGPHPGG